METVTLIKQAAHSPPISEAAAVAVALAEGQAALANQSAAEIITEAQHQIETQEITVKWLSDRVEELERSISEMREMMAAQALQTLEASSIIAEETAIAVTEETLSTSEASSDQAAMETETDPMNILETSKETSLTVQPVGPESEEQNEALESQARQKRKARKFL